MCLSSLKNTICTFVIGRWGGGEWGVGYVHVHGAGGLNLQNLSVRTLWMTPKNIFLTVTRLKLGNK